MYANEREFRNKEEIIRVYSRAFMEEGMIRLSAIDNC
jgi:mannitol/fructose-specific phosphotransferase system IIA component